MASRCPRKRCPLIIVRLHPDGLSEACFMRPEPASSIMIRSQACSSMDEAVGLSISDHIDSVMVAWWQRAPYTQVYQTERSWLVLKEGMWRKTSQWHGTYMRNLLSRHTSAPLNKLLQGPLIKYGSWGHGPHTQSSRLQRSTKCPGSGNQIQCCRPSLSLEPFHHSTPHLTACVLRSVQPRDTDPSFFSEDR